MGRVAALFALVLLAYSPALTGGFIWDDDGHVTKAELQSVAGLGRIWFEPGASQQYYPVIHSFFWVQHRLWGDWAPGYHALNILLHGTASCLLALVLTRLLAPGDQRIRGSEGQKADPLILRSSDPLIANNAAWLAAALFAIHPVMVESVAWISEQKNTLSAVFYLWAALVYLKYCAVGRPLADASTNQASASGRPTGWYVFASLLYVLACLSKTVTASLPAALLVVTWWKRGKIEWRRDVVPLLPWFAFGLAAGLFTAWVEWHFIGAQGGDYDLPLVERLLLAGRVIWFYLGKLFLPVQLSFNYPRWTMNAASLLQWLPLAGTLALLVSLWLIRSRSRAPLAAFLFFAGTLFPALGFFNVYPFQYSYVADHFQYLASIGIFTLLAAGLTRLRSVLRPLSSVVICAVLVALTALSALQSRSYANSDRLWEVTIARNPTSWLARDAIAQVLLANGKLDDALVQLNEALRLHPEPPQQNNLALGLEAAGRIREAIPLLEAAARAWPNYIDAHNNLGTAYARTGRLPEAIPEIEQAIAMKPKEPKFHYNLGLALRDSGRMDDAMREFRTVLTLQPESPEGMNALGYCLIRTNRPADAIPLLEAALRLRPGFPSATQNLAAARAASQRIPTK